MLAGQTWSHTLGLDVDACLRRVYYRVFAGWGGWNSKSDERTRLIYLARHSQWIRMYGGSLVHQAIRGTLQWYRTGRTLPDHDRLLHRLEARIREEIAYSASGIWKTLERPKQATLILHEHLIGQDLHSTWIEEEIARCCSCLSCFLQQYLPEIQESGPKGLEIIDSLDAIRYRGWTLFMVPDLVHQREGIFWITDWKTGRMPDPDQLSIYGLYLTQRHDVSRRVPVDRIRARSVPLLDPDHVAIVDMTEEKLHEATARIDRHLDLLIPLLDAGRAKDMQAFPCTPHRGICDGCLYQFLCEQER